MRVRAWPALISLALLAGLGVAALAPAQPKEVVFLGTTSSASCWPSTISAAAIRSSDDERRQTVDQTTRRRNARPLAQNKV
jgi:hypothetical protein